MESFLKVTKDYGVTLKQSFQHELLEAFPVKVSGDEDGGTQRLNIARIYDQKYNIILDKMYNKVDVADFEGTDEPQDICGYLGKTQYYRTATTKNPSSITAKDLIQTIFENNKMIEIMRTILEIDKERNGYVTHSELDDILKLYYPAKLEHVDLLPLIKKFSSI